MQEQESLPFDAPQDADAVSGESTTPVSVLTETGRWRARDVTYLAGSWQQLKPRIPQFELRDFATAPGEPANPHLKAVVRLPLTAAERELPVATVSHHYTLASHAAISEACLAALEKRGINPAILKCELGLTALGEWMNFRAYFPDEFSFTPADNKKLALRLECFNSVDGSSRLIILLGWLRLICSNGMIIGETMSTLRNIHDESLDLTVIPELITSGMKKIEQVRGRIKTWEQTPVGNQQLIDAVDGKLAETWGKKAACSVYHLCKTGQEVEIVDPFDAAPPSEKAVRATGPVPGAVVPAVNLYDVSQALSWVASRRNNPEERMEWQSQISGLVTALGRARVTA